MKHGKVNPPASMRRKRKRQPQGPGVESLALPRGVKTFLLLALTVAAALAVTVFAIRAVPDWVPREEAPWETYPKRVKADPEQSRGAGREVYVYQYRPGEVEFWVAGVRSGELSRAEFIRIIERAVRLLRARDAVAVLEAAAQARPEWPEPVHSLARELRETIQGSGAEERSLRQTLDRILAPAETSAVPGGERFFFRKMNPNAGKFANSRSDWMTGCLHRNQTIATRPS